MLTLQDCLWKFCAPEELEQRVMRVVGTSGIVTAAILGEYNVRLVYDPTQFTQKEAIQTFKSATGLEVVVTER